MILKGRRVLVTRPEAQQAGLCALLRAAGAEPVSLPMLRIVPILPDDPGPPALAARRYLQRLDEYARIIFVSTNAVGQGLAWIDHFWPQRPRGIRAYGVGTATARALLAAGIDATAPDAVMDSEALLALPELQAVDGERILIVRGVGGRSLMAEVLAARGARVDYAEVYRRECPDYDNGCLQAALNPLPDAVLAGSVQTVEHVQSYLRGHEGWATLPLVVPGLRVAEAARALGFRQVIAAEDARDTSLLAALQAHEDTGERP